MTSIEEDTSNNGNFFSNMLNNMTTTSKKVKKKPRKSKVVKELHHQERKLVTGSISRVLPADASLQESTPPEEETEDDSSRKDHVSLVTAGQNKFVSEEVQRERTDQLRKERQDATVALQKQNKEKEINEHRRKPPGGDSINTFDKTDVKELPAILTVTSQFPEHKRTGKEASLPPDSEPSEKKTKYEKSIPANDSNLDQNVMPWKWIGVGLALAISAAFAIKTGRRK